MLPAPIRILVVEDHEPFRRLLCSVMQSRADWKVIGEETDGQEAVRNAGQLQPDLVLLDIGLPTLNGIEAGRQIQAVSPNSKILFVSQETSPDIVEAAIGTGARGYVNKSDAGSELITAVQAVLLGQTYLSRSVAGDTFVEASSLPVPTPTLCNEKSPHHEVGFYADDRSLWDARLEFVRAALKDGNAAVVIASEAHEREFLSRLQADGVDVSAAIEQGRYLAEDVADALSAFMVDGLPDPNKFSKLAGELIKKAAMSVDGDISRVFACGEATTLLWEQGNTEGVVRLEHFWDQMAKSCPVRVHCGYVLSSFHNETSGDVYGRICAEHSAVLSL